MDYQDPTDLSSLEQGIEAKKETESKQVIRSVDPKIMGLAGIAALILVYLYYTNAIDAKLAAIMLLGVVAIVYFMGQQQQKSTNHLTYEECCYYLEMHLNYMQQHAWGEYTQIDPASKYSFTPITRERWIDNKPWKRLIGVIITRSSGLEDHHMAEINTTSGDLISLVRTDEIWDGRNMDDVKTTYRPSEALAMEKRTQQWLKPLTQNKQ